MGTRYHLGALFLSAIKKTADLILKILYFHNFMLVMNFCFLTVPSTKTNRYPYLTVEHLMQMAVLN